MTYTTEILDQESGIQYQGVKDKSGSTGVFPVIGLITGSFRRGRFDKPMTITNSNIRAMLGYDPTNPAYIAVQDALAQGVPSVQVIRIASGVDYEEPTQPELPPEDECDCESSSLFTPDLTSATTDDMKMNRYDEVIIVVEGDAQSTWVSYADGTLIKSVFDQNIAGSFADTLRVTRHDNEGTVIENISNQCITTSAWVKRKVNGSWVNTMIYPETTLCAASGEVMPVPIAEGQLKSEDIIGDGWSVLTFDDYGSINPTYTRNNSVLGQVTVTTHACFQGQQIVRLDSGAYSMLGSTPAQGQPLSFDTASGFYAEVKSDSSNPDSPVLAGSVQFDAPISVLFSKDVHAVALTGGFFDNIGSTYIEVYDRLGNVLGSAVNTGTGLEEFGFSVGSEAKIAGFSFYVNDYEGSGFAMDNLKFQ